MFKYLKEKYKAYRHKKRWSVELQMYYLRQQLLEDYQWLANDKTCVDLIERYLKMTRGDWMQQSRMSISDFRISIGKEPCYGQSKGNNDNKS